MLALILPYQRVPSRNLDPGQRIRLPQNYRGRNPTVSGTTGRFGFNLSLRYDFDTIGGIKSGVSKILGLRSDNKHAKLSSYTIDPAAAYEKPNQKSTLQASAGLVIDVLKESSDVCTPLKSVAGGLCAVLKYYDVWYPCSAKPFTPLTFEQANGGKSWNNRVINTPSRRPCRITRHSCSRG